MGSGGGGYIKLPRACTVRASVGLKICIRVIGYRNAKADEEERVTDYLQAIV